jgi:hypothetical protein
MFEVENTRICSNKMVFEVCTGYISMLLIKRKNNLEIFHHVFSTFTQARGSKGGVQLKGGILKGILHIIRPKMKETSIKCTWRSLLHVS